jgi:hypothetical protein
MPRVVDKFAAGQRGAGFYSDYSPLKGLLDFEDIILDAVEQAGAMFQEATDEALDTVVDVIKALTGIDLSTYAKFIEDIDADGWAALINGLSVAMGLPIDLGDMLIQIYDAFDGIDITDPGAVLTAIETAVEDVGNDWVSLVEAFVPSDTAGVQGDFNTIIGNTLSMLGNPGPSLATLTFNPVAAADAMITDVLGPTGLLPLLSGLGLLSGGVIPSLDASKIASGTFLQSLIPSLTVAWPGTINAEVLVGALAGAVSVPGSSIVSVLSQNVIPSLTAAGGYVGTIENGVVTGIQGIASIGATVQTYLDNAAAGIAARFGLGIAATNASPTQVQTATNVVATAAQNAAALAQTVAATFVQQGISQPMYLGGDPTMSASFPLNRIQGMTTPPLINVTQTQSAMVVIPATTGNLIKAFVWEGQGLSGSLTGITSLVVNIYQMNTTTGVQTRLNSSGNLIGSLSASLGREFYNLTSANFITPTIGNIYIAEIQILGTGTYQVAGLTGDWVGTSTTVFPKNSGLTRGPALPTFISAGTAQAQSTAATTTWTETVPTGAEAVYIVHIAQTGSTGVGTVTGSVGGVAATLIEQFQFATNGSTAAWNIDVLRLFNPTVGTSETVTVESTGSTLYQVRTFYFSGVSAEGTIVKTPAESGVAVTQTVTGTLANELYLNVLAANAGTASGQAFTAYNQTQEWSVAVNAALAKPGVVGIAAGNGGSLTFSGTAPVSASDSWGSVVVPLIGVVPPAPTTIADPTTGSACQYSPNIPWIGFTGSAGRTTMSPQTTVFNNVTGPVTYQIPSVNNGGWMIAGDKLDVIMAGAGGGGNTGGTELGGAAGSWYTRTFVLGTDIPMTTTTITFNIGAGGAVTALGVAGSGSNGGATTAAITGVVGSPFSAAGGTGGGNTGTPIGQAMPSSPTLNGVSYPGGGSVSGGSAGNTPGGGGAGEITGVPITAGVGGNGEAIIVAYQAT